MSTKISLFYNDRIHIYQECFDEENIFIATNHPHLQITQELSLDDFVAMTASINLQSLLKQANITDEKIKNYVELQVAKRAKNECIFSLLHESVIFGKKTDSFHDQVKRGIEFYTKKRNRLQNLLEKIKVQKQCYFFGLEDLA